MKLETDRLLLREFVADDWPAVLNYQSDPRYLRDYEWTGRTPEEVRQFIEMFLEHQREIPRLKFQFAVTLKENARLIGNCGIRLQKAGAHEGDIGYEIDPNFWGNGYATEAACNIVQFGFDRLGLQRVWSWCVADNLGSVRVLEKLGMQLEGRLRRNEFYKGRYWDTLMYGILASEWRPETLPVGYALEE